MLIYGGVMLKKLLIIISMSLLFSQDQSITNVTVGQLTDGSGLIEVSYDLIDGVHDPTDHDRLCLRRSLSKFSLSKSFFSKFFVIMINNQFCFLLLHN